jgi:hypothetical protein
MNRNKSFSTTDGKGFLRKALELEQAVLATQLKLSQNSITHNGLQGEVNEEHFICFLRKYLPRRYSVDQGIVIDCLGQTSQQIDVIIYDNQYTPTLLDQQNHRYIIAEAVYAVLEVKPTVDKSNLAYAADKAQSVRSLHRTSVPIPHAGGIHPAKALFPILAGIVGDKAGWKHGLLNQRFSQALDSFKDAQTLNFGLALHDRAFLRQSKPFDLTLCHGKLYFSQPQGSLAWFLFTLLQRLQDLGTVPAVDWSRYRDVMSL